VTPVETRLLLPYLERHLAPHTGSDARYAAASELAKRSGVGVRELKRILAGQVETVDFETADGLLTAVGCPHVWQSDPELADIYSAQAGDESPARVKVDPPRSESPPPAAATVLEALASPAFAAVVRAIVAEEVERQLAERDTPPEWLDVERAAERYGLTADALRKRAQRGQLPHVRDGRRLLFERRALDSALESATIPGENANGRAPRKRPRPGTGGISSDA
jgi:excisionase family DNA binding protein